MRSATLLFLGRLSLALVLTLLACAERVPETGPGAPPGASSSSLAELSRLDARPWVSVYDPEKAWNGYTLVLYKQRIPMLIDMNGRIVHAWPQARVKSRVRLNPDGSLLGIALGRAVVEYDWRGNLIWEHRLEECIPHHDVVRMKNGNTMALVRAVRGASDDLLEIDREGEVVWEWRSGEHLQSYFDRASQKGDITHINSVQELPPNPWYERGDARFRPGNLLLSARNLDTVFLIDKATGEVLWTFDEEMDRQHEALMLGPGFSGHGNILIFNNRSRSFHTDRSSEILEIAPQDGSVVWRYRSDGFFTPTGGIEQPLPNGNLLISSTRGGRAFEITRGGEIVWQWTPPFDPRRPARYAYDHCPQLAALGRPKQVALTQAKEDRWVDRDVYRFARQGNLRTVDLRGKKRKVLKSNRACRRLFLPAGAEILLEYGLFPQPRRSRSRVRFGVLLRELASPGDDAGERIVLFEETVTAGEGTSFSQTVSLSPYAHAWVELCLRTEELAPEPTGASPIEELAWWSNPRIESASVSASSEEVVEGLSEEELAVRKEHLKALGYVD